MKMKSNTSKSLHCDLQLGFRHPFYHQIKNKECRLLQNENIMHRKSAGENLALLKPKPKFPWTVAVLEFPLYMQTPIDLEYRSQPVIPFIFHIFSFIIFAIIKNLDCMVNSNLDNAYQNSMQHMKIHSTVHQFALSLHNLLPRIAIGQLKVCSCSEQVQDLICMLTRL